MRRPPADETAGEASRAGSSEEGEGWGELRLARREAIAGIWLRAARVDWAKARAGAEAGLAAMLGAVAVALAEAVAAGVGIGWTIALVLGGEGSWNFPALAPGGSAVAVSAFSWLVAVGAAAMACAGLGGVAARCLPRAGPVGGWLGKATIPVVAGSIALGWAAGAWRLEANPIQAKAVLFWAMAAAVPLGALSLRARLRLGAAARAAVEEVESQGWIWRRELVAAGMDSKAIEAWASAMAPGRLERWMLDPMDCFPGEWGGRGDGRGQAFGWLRRAIPARVHGWILGKGAEGMAPEASELFAKKVSAAELAAVEERFEMERAAGQSARQGSRGARL